MYLNEDYDDLYQKLCKRKSLHSVSINMIALFIHVLAFRRQSSESDNNGYGCFLWIYITVSAWMSLEMSSKL